MTKESDSRISLLRNVNVGWWIGNQPLIYKPKNNDLNFEEKSRKLSRIEQNFLNSTRYSAQSCIFPAAITITMLLPVDISFKKAIYM